MFSQQNNSPCQRNGIHYPQNMFVLSRSTALIKSEISAEGGSGVKRHHFDLLSRQYSVHSLLYFVYLNWATGEMVQRRGRIKWGRSSMRVMVFARTLIRCRTFSFKCSGTLSRQYMPSNSSAFSLTTYYLLLMACHVGQEVGIAK